MKRILLRRSLRPLLIGFVSFLLTAISWSGSFSQDIGILKNGDLSVTGFSGTTKPPEGEALPTGTSMLDEMFIDRDGVSLRVFSRPKIVTNATVSSAANKLEIRAGDIGQVFGIALDDKAHPNIYVGATSAFGLQIVTPDTDTDGRPERIKIGQPGAQWMVGQFGSGAQSSPGSIWKVDGVTGTVSLFANVMSNGTLNSGPGLGQLAFDPVHQQLLVSDLDTGLIHRFDMAGNDLGIYDHGVTGRPARQLEPVAQDVDNRADIQSSHFDAEAPDTWGFADPRRRVWAVAVHHGRLFYSVAKNGEIWSVGLGKDGGFLGDARYELALPKKATKNPVSDITFTAKGEMIVAQRGGIQSRYDYSRFHTPRNNRVLRYLIEWPENPETPGRWQIEPQEYAIGFGASQRNASGGLGLSCNGTLWVSGDALRDNPVYAERLSQNGSAHVHGLQAVAASQIKPANVPPWQSMFLDFDGKFDDSNAAGLVGDVEVFRRCEKQGQIVEVPSVFPPISCPESPYCPQNKVYPDLQITKTAIQNTCKPGKNCRFLIEVRNSGDQAYFGPLWIQDKSNGAKMTGYGPQPWRCGSRNPAGFSCWRGDVYLAPGEAVFLRTKLRIPKTWKRPVYKNCARIRWTWWKNGDANSANDGPACAIVPINKQPDLSDMSIKKTAEKAVCKKGHDCFFNIKIRNNGPAAFNGVPSFEDKVPAGLIYQGLGQMSQWQCQHSASRIFCTLPTGGVAVSPGDLGEVRLHFKVRPGFRGKSITNTAKVHADAEIDSNPGNNSSLATVKIEDDIANPAGDGFDLQIVKSPLAGETCTADKRCHFNVKIVNWGPRPFTGDIEFVDKAPLGMKFVATGIAPGWQCTTLASGAAITCKFANASLARQATTDAVSIGYTVVKAGKYRNCAKLVNVPAGDKVSVNNEGCAWLEVGQNGQPGPEAQNFPIKVIKTARAPGCLIGKPCIFDISVENMSLQEYSANLKFDDAFITLPQLSPIAHPNSQIGTQFCTMTEGNFFRYSCEANVTLQAGEKKTFAVVYIIPDNIGIKPGDKLQNTFTVRGPPEIPGGTRQGIAQSVALVVIGATDEPGGGVVEEFPLKVILQFSKRACVVGQPCTLEVRVRNTSSQPFAKNFSFTQTMFVFTNVIGNSINLKGTAFETDEPFCGNARESDNYFFRCMKNFTFEANETRSFYITLTIPDGKGIKPGDRLSASFKVTSTNDYASHTNQVPIAGSDDTQGGVVPLTVQKTARNATCSLEQDCTFDVILINNSGQDISEQVRISEIPQTLDGLTTVFAKITQTNQTFCNWSGGRVPIICDNVNLNIPAGGRKGFYVSMKLGNDSDIKVGDKVKNCFNVHYRGHDYKSCATVTVTADQSFEIKKTARSATCSLNKSCVFDIELINNSSQSLSKHISILEHPQFTGQKSGSVVVPFTVNDGPFNCAPNNRIPFYCTSTPISIAANAKLSFSMAVTLGNDSRVKVGDTVENCIEVTISGQSGAYNACAPVTVVEGPNVSGVFDLEVIKTATTQTCEIGKPCTIDAQIWNRSSNAFPLGANFRVADSVKIGNQNIAGIVAASNQTLCPILDNGRFVFSCERQLSMGGGQTLNYSLTVNIPDDPSLAGKKLTNSLRVSLSPNGLLNTWNGTASVDIIDPNRTPPAGENAPPPPPQLSLTKTGPAKVRAGQVVDVQLVISNPARFPARGPYDLRARFLAGTITTTQISSIAPAFGCNPALTGVPKDCSVNINLAAGQSRAHNFKIKVPDGLPVGHRGVSCTVLSPSGQTANVNVARIADQVSSGKFSPNGDGYACWQFTIATPEELAQNQQNLGQQPPPEESNLLCRNGMQLSQEGACSCPANRPWNGLYCGGTSASEPQANACGSGMQLSQNGVCSCPSNRPWNGLYCGGVPDSQQLNEAPEVNVTLEPETRDRACRQGMVYTSGRGCSCPVSRPWNGSYCGGTPPVGFTDDTGGSNVDDDKGNTPQQAQLPPPNLSISKTLNQRACKAGEKCTYRISLKNSSFAPFSGPVEISDQISLRGARLVSVSPRRWSCSGQSSRYVCRNPRVQLNAGSATQLQLTFTMPARVSGQIKNCAAIVWRSATQKRLRTAAVQHALGRLGYKIGSVDGVYGSATARAILQYQRRNKLPIIRGINQKLLGQLFGRWGRGDGNSADDRACITTSISRLPGVISCPNGFVLVKKRCVSLVRPPKCTQEQVFVNGRCIPRPNRCRGGTKWNNNLKRCVTPAPTCRQGTSYDPDVRRCISNCRPGQRWSGNRCVSTCRQGQKWNGNRCTNVCRRGQKWTGNRCTNVCRRGQKWTGRQCINVCRSGQRWTGNKCTNVCRRGQKWNGRQCINVCRSGQRWTGNRCTSTCRRGQKWNGRQCISACRSGQRWNGKRCVGRAPSGSVRPICTGGRYFDRKIRRCTCGRNNTWDPRRRRCRAL